MRGGDTFLVANDRHLKVVISDPTQDDRRVLVVSITTRGPKKDQACVLPRGCHPFVTHDSCVAYGFAAVATLNEWLALKDAGLLELREPVSPALLNQIRESAADSTSMADEHAQILIDQGLLDV